MKKLSLALLAASVLSLTAASAAISQDRLADKIDLNQRPFWTEIPPPNSVLDSPDVPRTEDGLPDVFAEWLDHYQPLIPRGQATRDLRAEDGDLVLPEDFVSPEAYQAFLDRSAAENPQIICIPPMAGRIVGQPYKLEILRSGDGARLDKIVFLHEVESVIRKAYLDYPDLEPNLDLRPYWGTSKAKWEDRSGDGQMDTLAVHTEGIVGGWIEQIGLTYETGATVDEVYWLNEDGSILHLDYTLTDPKTYAHPIKHHIWWERADNDADATFNE